MKGSALLAEIEEGNELYSNEILEVVPLTFEENLIVSASDCPDYGCTCIALSLSYVSRTFRE